MVELTIKANVSDPREISPLIELAVGKELKMLQQSMRRIKEDLSDFERRYGMKTEQFYDKFIAGQLGDAMDFIEWSGEYESLKKIKEDVRKLESIEYVD